MIKYFFRLVELKTKLVPLFSFFITIFILLMFNYEINIKLTILFFIAMILFDLATTGLNTIYGINNEKIDTKDNKGLRERMEELGITNKHNIVIVSVMIFISTIIGVYLVFNSSIWLLLFGALSFGIGILYSAGPIPICKTFLGEILSGLGEGILLPLCLLVINDVNPFSIEATSIVVNIKELSIIILLLLPFTIAISMLMLANNIEDYNEDVANNRLTLVYYLGEDKSIVLFKIMYFVSWIVIIIGYVLSILSIYFLLMGISFFVVFFNVLNKKKGDMFKLQAVKNMAIIGISFLICSIITIISG